MFERASFTSRCQLRLITFGKIDKWKTTPKYKNTAEITVKKQTYGLYKQANTLLLLFATNDEWDEEENVQRLMQHNKKHLEYLLYGFFFFLLLSNQTSSQFLTPTFQTNTHDFFSFRFHYRSEKFPFCLVRVMVLIICNLEVRNFSVFVVHTQIRFFSLDSQLINFTWASFFCFRFLKREKVFRYSHYFALFESW